MKKYKKLYLITIILITFSLSLIISFNYFIDPYNIYKTQSFKRLNEKKIENKEYIMKARDLVSINPNTIFLGSSRTKMGLDPSYYHEITKEKVYNSGLPNSNIYIQMRYLEYAIQQNPSLRKVMLGLDFEGFNRTNQKNAQFNDQRLSTKFFIKEDLISTLLTEQAIKDSFKVIIDNVVNSEKFINDNTLPNGSQDETIILSKNKKLLSEGKNSFYVHLREQIEFKTLSNEYELSDKYIDALKKIVSICNENNIELLIFIQPVHVLQLEGITNIGIWNEFEEWKKQIVSITPIWDFSNYNSITTSPPTNFEYYIDQSHYRKKVGNLIMNRMLEIKPNVVPNDFGILLTKENIQIKLEGMKDDRNDWEEKNPIIVRKVKEIIDQYK